jgi:hypothetical protein
MAHGEDRIESGTDLQEKVLGMLEEAGFSQEVNDKIVAMISEEERRLHAEINRDEAAADAALLEVLECLHLVWTADEESGSNPLVVAYIDAAFSRWHRGKLSEGHLLNTYEELIDKFGNECAWVSPPFDALICVAEGLANQWDADADLAENYVVRAFMTAFETLKEAGYYEDPNTDVERAYNEILAAPSASFSLAAPASA